MLGSNPGLLRLWHWQSDALTIQLDPPSARSYPHSVRSHPHSASLDLIHPRLDLIHIFRHLVALRDLEAGELIFSENPVATGPGESSSVCIVCYSFIGDSVCNRWARGVSALSDSRLSERVSAIGEHVACLHAFFCYSLHVRHCLLSATGEHLSALSATPFFWYRVCYRWALGVSALSAIPSSETVSATGEHMACLNSLLFLHRRQCLQQVST